MRMCAASMRPVPNGEATVIYVIWEAVTAHPLRSCPVEATWRKTFFACINNPEKYILFRIQIPSFCKCWLTYKCTGFNYDHDLPVLKAARRHSLNSAC